MPINFFAICGFVCLRVSRVNILSVQLVRFARGANLRTLCAEAHGYAIPLLRQKANLSESSNRFAFGGQGHVAFELY